MIIEVIPPKNWSSFLEYFSQLHKELPCSIHILDGSAELTAGEEMKFAHISFTDKSESDLNIIAQQQGKEINHLVKKIKQICITRSNDEGDSAILIESQGNFITSLNFNRESED